MVSKHALYKYLKFNPILSLLDYDDVMQELSIVEFLYSNSDFNEARRSAVNAIYRLSADYGFSRKKGKDNFNPFYNSVEFSEEEESLINNIELLYIDNNLTAREISVIYAVEYNNKFQKILCQLFPKNMGLGGKRKNSGNTKLKN